MLVHHPHKERSTNDAWRVSDPGMDALDTIIEGLHDQIVTFLGGEKIHKVYLKSALSFHLSLYFSQENYVESFLREVSVLFF
jgi:hypothetical protein